MNIAPHSNHMFWPNGSTYPFPVYPMSIGQYVNQPAITRDGHMWHEFHMITKGVGVYTINGEKFTLSVGDGIFMRADFKCSYESIDNSVPFSTSWVAFTGGDELLDLYNISDHKIFKYHSYLHKYHQDIINVCENRGSEAQRSASCYYFVVEMLESISKQERDISVLINKYLMNNYNKNITIDDVADEVRMSKYALYRYLKKHNMESIANQIKNIRISKAEIMLKDTNYPTSQIGSFCGFESPSYFCKVFREQTGLTPLEYREKKL